MNIIDAVKGSRLIQRLDNDFILLCKNNAFYSFKGKFPVQYVLTVSDILANWKAVRKMSIINLEI